SFAVFCHRATPDLHSFPTRRSSDLNIQVAVLGLGISGQAAAELLSKEGAMVTVFDTSEKERLKDRIRYLESLGVRVVAAPDAAADHSNYRCAVISPGVDPSSPLVRSFVERRIEMI